MRFDLQETQSNILEKYPEWRDLVNAVEYRNIPEADPAGYNGRIVYYNSRRMNQFPQDVQAFIIAQQLMHIQLAHQRRGADEFLLEKADKEEPEPEDDEKSEEQAEEIDVFVSDRDNKDKQAGGLEGAQDRDIEDPGLAQAVEGLSDLMEPSLQMDYDWFPADRIRDGILKEQFRPYPVPHAEILLDTSASIDEDLLRAFVRGVKDLLREDAVIKVGCFDTEFYGFQEIHSEKDISSLEIKGAGGTNFETAVKAFTGDAETRIIFTDGYADMPTTRCDAIWLVYSDTPVSPPGGRVLYVRKPEEIKDHEINFLIT